MSQLLYCVFHTAEHSKPAALFGVNGRAVLVAGYRGIGCAISSVDPTDIVPDRVRITTYEKVVESFQREHTVVPMRYGCVFDDELSAVRFLRENRKRFRSLLAELRDCVEMGIRVLLETEPPDPHCSQRFVVRHAAAAECRRFPAEDATLPPAKRPFEASPSHGCVVTNRLARGCVADDKPDSAKLADGAGASYLHTRKSFYQGKERLSEEAVRLTKRISTVLDGLYVKLETEGVSGKRLLSPFRGSVLSLNFLVSRDRVEPFRAAFRGLEKTGGSKFLISGPWPPYNFASPDGGFGALERQSLSFDFRSR
ncbi:MAG: GvpL/GvpF family gas vesicle protein [Planctomycetota bacterium]|nr:GvpL/GvpF family gas vesicle protein [Planctomycetota bacterium]